MPGPQLENGHIRIANELWEALSRTRIPGEARQVLGAIIRLTWGWGKKSDTISTKQLYEATGIPKPRIIRARKKLMEMNIINVAQKGNEKAPKYCFNKHYPTWKTLPKKATPKTLPKKATGVAQKGNKTLPKKATSLITNHKAIKTILQSKAEPIIFDKETWTFLNITQDQVNRWKQAFPLIDICTEILKAGLWLESKNQSPHGRASEFLFKWFGKAKPEIQESDEKPDSYYCS